MDVNKARKGLEKDRATTRQPLRPAEKNNAVTTRRPPTKEISSRYKSPQPSGPRRCPSPNITRTIYSELVPKRAISAERKRPSTPPSPSSPSTPVRSSSIDFHVSSRRLSAGRLPESLWPSTMRSLSVSFQSDNVSIPVGKKEKQVKNPSGDRTLRPSSNVAQRQGVSTSSSRRSTPERKRSPLKGNNATDHSENLKPCDSSLSRTIDQHRWPSRTGRKITSNSLNKSVDLFDKPLRGLLSSTTTGTGLSPLRRLSLSDGLNKPAQRSSSDTARLLSNNEAGCSGYGAKSVDATLELPSGSKRLLSASSLDRNTLATAAARLHLLHALGSRPASPSRTSLSSSSIIARGFSPSRARPSTPPSRGVSPSRIRQTSNSMHSSSTTSVLSFNSDVKKWKKGASHVEDAHQLRLLYNRLLQWRFANSHAEAVMYFQRITAEETLYNVQKATLDLLDLVTSKRVSLEQLKLGIKLNSIMNNQMRFLDDWAVLEQDHVSSLAGAIDDLLANTLRLQVTEGATADKESLKAAISSALDVMQAMGSSISSLLSKVEEMNSLVSELAFVASKEKSMLDKCEVLLASKAAMQIEGCSLSAHLIQLKLEESPEDKEPLRVFPSSIFPWP